MEVLEISIQNRTVRVHAMVWSFTIGNTSNVVFNVVPANLEPYVLSANRNSLVILGCGFQATTRMTMPSQQGAAVFPLCMSYCTVQDQQNKVQPAGQCAGVGCCEAAIPTGLTSFNIQFLWLDKNATAWPPWIAPNVSVLVVEKEWWRDTNTSAFKVWLLSLGHVTGQAIPVMLDWIVGQSSCMAAQTRPEFGCVSKNSECINSTSSACGYVCWCNDGYDGNPYMPDGCQGSLRKHVTAGKLDNWMQLPSWSITQLQIQDFKLRTICFCRSISCNWNWHWFVPSASGSCCHLC